MITGNVVTAPLPGRIIELKVKVGDAVKAGQEVAVLEAMKMENAITSDFAGTVKQILVRQGQTVATDAVLMEIEKPDPFFPDAIPAAAPECVADGTFFRWLWY